jgi:adenylate cyclase
VNYGELIPIGGGDTIPLLKEKLLVGRRESCDIRLRFDNVSAHHCQLFLEQGYWFVKDLGSRNGTKVNGKRVSRKRIDPGDTISFAKHQYELHYQPSDLGASGPPPPDEETIAEIMARSLLDRAGLDKKTRDGEEL